MKSIGSWKITTKIVAFLLLTEILFLSIVISSSYFFSTKLLKENASLQISELGPLLNSALVTPLLQKDYATVRAITSEITESKFIIKVIILNTQGQEIANSSSRWFKENEKISAVSSVALNLGDIQLGSAQVTLSKSGLLDLQKKALQDTIYVAIASIFLFLIIAIVLARNLSSPIIKLLSFTKNYDEQDFSKIAFKSRNDEIGELYRAYEIMLNKNKIQINSLIKSRAALQEREEIIDNALESIQDAFGLFDSEDYLILCNSEYAKTFTIFNSFAEIKGMKFEEIVRSSLKYKGEVIGQGFDGDQEAWIKERIRRHQNPDENMFQVIEFSSGKWLRVSEKRTNRGGIVGIRTDISELKKIQKNLEENILEKNKLLKSMATLFKSNSMGSMVSSLAHEINSPLGSISIHSELLRIDLKEIAERHDLSELDHLTLLADQIFLATQKASLVVTRLRSLFTHGEDKFELFNLSIILNDIIGLMSGEIANEKIHLNLKVDDNLMIYGDVNQIQMVIINILKNSMEALRNISDQRIITVVAQAENGKTRVGIADNGPGFKDFILKSGFELFKTSKPNGMGVGMWLGRAIMENHNGSINATNNSGGGANTTLIFYEKNNRQGNSTSNKI